MLNTDRAVRSEHYYRQRTEHFSPKGIYREGSWLRFVQSDDTAAVIGLSQPCKSIFLANSYKTRHTNLDQFVAGIFFNVFQGDVKRGALHSVPDDDIYGGVTVVTAMQLEIRLCVCRMNRRGFNHASDYSPRLPAAKCSRHLATMIFP